MKKFIKILLPFILIILVLTGCSQAAPAQPQVPTNPVASTDLPAPLPSPSFTPTAVTPPTEPATPEPTAGAVVLTVVGPGGEKTFTLDELKQLPALEGMAGIKSSTGKITLPALFKGVALTDLVEEVGGLDPSLGINVIAEDGYAMTFSYDQLNQGNFIAYDPATGDEKKLYEPLQVILAYEMDGQPLPQDSDGTLRMAMISPKNNQVTDGHWSVKWVERVEAKPLGEEWSLQLTGVITDVVDRNSFQSCAAASCHQASWTDDKAQIWVGTPLWYLAGRMDDEIKHDGPAYNVDLASAGYLLQIVAADGYSTTLSSSQVMHNKDIIVAYQVNENPLPDKYFPLRLVGAGLEKNQLVGQIAEIRMIYDPMLATQAAPSPTVSAPTSTPVPQSVQGDLVIIGLVEQALGLNEADLRQLEATEITAEHPKKGQQTYQGILLTTLLEMAKVKPEATQLVITASDGYTAEVDLSTVLACSECMLAFTDTPGLFNLVMPGMESSLWVKETVSLEVK